MLRVAVLLLLFSAASCRWSRWTGQKAVGAAPLRLVALQRERALTAIDVLSLRGGESRRKKDGKRSKKKAVAEDDEEDDEGMDWLDDAVASENVEAAKGRKATGKGKRAKEARAEAEDVDFEEEDSGREDFEDEDDPEMEMGAEEGAGIVQRGWAFLRKTPLMTRCYLLASIFSTIASAAFCRNQWPGLLDLKWGPTLKSLQLWRLLTPFLYLGPLNIFWLFNLNVCWTQMATLEKLMYKNPENFLVMIAFGCASLLGIYGLTSLSPKMLGINLMVYTTYVWARCFEGQQINVMDVFVVPAELLPWFFVAQTWVQEGEFPITDLMGIAVGHLYLMLRQNNLLEAPTFVRQLFQSPTMKRHYRRLGQDFA